MLRRISTKFGKGKKEEVNGVNGTDNATKGSTNGVQTNGAYTNGTSSEKPSSEKRHSSFGIQSKKARKAATNDSASRSDVESSFAQFAQLIHASERPLPTQSGGGGAYLDPKEPSGLMSDIKALGFKDAHTLMDVMKNKASGALQDDKTYLMEKTIQVSQSHRAHVCCSNEILACCCLAYKFENESRFDQCIRITPLILETCSITKVMSQIDELWNSLQHPPMSYLGDKFAYRSADGSNNVSHEPST